MIQVLVASDHPGAVRHNDHELSVGGAQDALMTMPAAPSHAMSTAPGLLAATCGTSTYAIRPAFSTNTAWLARLSAPDLTEHIVAR